MAAAFQMKMQGYLLRGTLPGAVVEDKGKQTESGINVGQDEENPSGLAKKYQNPWDAWGE